MISLKSTDEIIRNIAARAKEMRLQLQLTQKGLSSRSGVSLGSIKKFEQTGQISIKSLVKIAFILDCHDQFDELFKEKKTYSSLDEALGSKNNRKRGKIT